MQILIRLLQESELQTADRIFRLAFETFTQSTNFFGDTDLMISHWKADPTAAFAAEVDGRLLGSNLATNWGSVSFFGPLSVHPDFWNQGIGQRLIEAALDRFAQWGTQQAGLFTFSHSPKHHALYQKFGFYPRFLTFIMAKQIQAVQQDLPGTTYSELNQELQSQCLSECFELTNAIYEGLDVSREILAVHAQGLGDTVLLRDTRLAGFAVCHCGAGTEAGSNTCYVKFGAVRPGAQAAEKFEQLLDLCETYSAFKGMSRLVAGINTSHSEAYARMVARHFRTDFPGLVMQKPNQPGYHRPDVFVLDDWR
jgi:GNAT superfamily N-acetyltransferase